MSIKKKFVIRVDASDRIGLGHLSRCILLGNFIKNKDHEVVFFTEQSVSQNIIESEGHKCYRVSYRSSDLIKLNYSYSLIVDINSDEIFNSNSEYYNYLDHLGKNAEVLITFEDLINYPYCADVVIIPYCGANNLKLINGCKSEYLLGPKYFPLKDGFQYDSYIVSKRANKILVTMGGSDPDKITLKVLNSISELNKAYDITILIGKVSKITNREVNLAMSNHFGQYKILKRVENICKLMLDCDVAITNSGLTKYELSALGVPSIIISNNKKHSKYTETFSSYGSSIHLGYSDVVTKKHIRENCDNLIEDYNLRLKMSKKGKSLVDINGLNRLWKVLEK